MFIVTLLVLTVILSYVLAGAAGEATVVQSANYELGPQTYKAYARDLILSNRFWIYLILGIGATLLISTTIAIALIMHVKFSAIVACVLAIGFFAARAFILKNAPRRRRSMIQLLQIFGSMSALGALVILLRS